MRLIPISLTFHLALALRTRWLTAMGFEDGAEVLGDPDGSVLGVAVGALLRTLEGMLLLLLLAFGLAH